ncbi:hypothetical protein GEMRC1_004422 [Eukaryota sp. GEM-RC1]
MPIVGSGSRRSRNTDNTSRGGGRGRGAAPKSRGSARGGSSSRGRFSFRRSGNNPGSSRPRGSGRNSFRRGGPTMRVPMKRHDANGKEYTEYKEVSTLTCCVTVLIVLGLLLMFNTPSASEKRHSVRLLPETTFDVTGILNAHDSVHIINGGTGSAYLCSTEPTPTSLTGSLHYQNFERTIPVDTYFDFDVFLNEKSRVMIAYSSMSGPSSIFLETIQSRSVWESWKLGDVKDQEKYEKCTTGQGCFYTAKSDDHHFFAFKNNDDSDVALWVDFSLDTHYFHDLTSCTKQSCSLADCFVRIPDGQKLFVATPDSTTTRLLHFDVTYPATGSSTRTLGVLLLALGIIGAVFSCMIEYKKHSTVSEYNNANNSLPSDPKGVQPPPIQAAYPGSIP